MNAFADGELAESDADSFRRHLPVCPQCLAELETIFALKALAESAGAPLPPRRR